MTSEPALREKVAEELWQAESVRAAGTRRNIPWSEAGPAARDKWLPLADAAIAVVLEEAARVAEDYGRVISQHPPWRVEIDGVTYEIPGSKIVDTSGGADIAAAIRGLKGKD
jgi:hypothetical protein